MFWKKLLLDTFGDELPEDYLPSGEDRWFTVVRNLWTTPDDPWFAGPELYPDISDRVNGFIGFYHPYDATMQFADQYFGGPEGSRDPQVIERLGKADSLAHAGCRAADLGVGVVVEDRALAVRLDAQPRIGIDEPALPRRVDLHAKAAWRLAVEDVDGALVPARDGRDGHRELQFEPAV